MSETKHDGKLDADGHLNVYLFKGPYASHMGIENSHRDTGDEEVLSPKQALSLLAWLEENRTRLEKLVREQAE
jgi:hypothetical protein